MRASTAAVMEDDRARRARAEEVVAYAGRRVAVTGAVRRPVVFMWDDRVTVLDAIAIARGPRPGASRAVVLRHTPEGLREIHVLLDDESTVTLSPGDEVRVLAA
jgi:protein involved in polysaccharide export with SLBB domain